MNPAEALWLSDWHLGLAGQHLLRFPQGLRAQPDPTWVTMPESHRVWLEQPYPHKIGTLPGGIPLQIKVPDPQPWEHWFPAWQPVWQEAELEQALWLPSSHLPQTPGPLRLEAVTTPAQWQQLAAYREEIELAVGGSPGEGEHMTAFQRFRAPHLQGHWYVAWAEGKPVASGGIFALKSPLGTLMRLQDIDVFPTYQGQGFGNQLLQALLFLAHGTAGVGVRAEAHDWPLQWYQRRGFYPVATWTTWRVA